MLEGLFPRQVNHMSDGFHTQFDSSPLFCVVTRYCYRTGATLSYNYNAYNSSIKMRLTPVGSMIILQS
jgi:hypothetical protein